MRNIIKKHEDFLMTENDQTARAAMFFIRAKPAKIPNDPRYGLMATKRTFRLAVDRNRAKRLLRDWIRYNEKLMVAQWDYVFIARRAILDASRTDGRVAMRKALRYLGRLHDKQKSEK